MRVKSISVTGLFGIFDHEIPMKIEDRTTIIHGPNGFGKTVLLRMIDSVLSAKFSELRAVVFRTLQLKFDNDAVLVVKRTDDTKASRATLTFEFSVPSREIETFTVGAQDRAGFTFPLEAIEHEIPELQRLGPETWVHIATGQRFSLADIFATFGEQLPFRQRRQESEPAWLVALRKSIPVLFIETQRLMRVGHSRRRAVGRERPLELAVVAYAAELTTTIQRTLAEYANLSQSLDRTFPTRLVTSDLSTELTVDQLRNELSSLEDKRSRLVEAGLLDSERGLDFRQLQAVDERNRNVLSVYVRDALDSASALGVARPEKSTPG